MGCWMLLDFGGTCCGSAAGVDNRLVGTTAGCWLHEGASPPRPPPPCFSLLVHRRCPIMNVLLTALMGFRILGLVFTFFLFACTCIVSVFFVMFDCFLVHILLLLLAIVVCC